MEDTDYKRDVLGYTLLDRLFRLFAHFGRGWERVFHYSGNVGDLSGRSAIIAPDLGRRLMVVD
jgi:hypothetical protein